MNDSLRTIPAGTLITSRGNTHIRQLDALLRQKKAREQSGLFALEGRRLCLDGWKAGLVPEQLLLTAEAYHKAPGELHPLVQGAGQVLWLDKELAERLGDTQNSQGIFSVCRAPAFLPEQMPLLQDGRYLLLYQVRDPGNVGSILRTAAALGMTGICLCDCAELLAPKVLRASMGGIWRMPVALWVEPAPMVQHLQAANIPVFAAALHSGAKGLEQLEEPGGAVLIGNEGDGLPEDLIDCCNGRIQLPMQGGSDSLGAAMAAGIFIWEMCK